MFPRFLNRVRATLPIGTIAIAFIFIGRFAFNLVESVATFSTLICTFSCPWMAIMVIGYVTLQDAAHQQRHRAARRRSSVKGIARGAGGQAALPPLTVRRQTVASASRFGSRSRRCRKLSPIVCRIVCCPASGTSAILCANRSRTRPGSSV